MQREECRTGWHRNNDDDGDNYDDNDDNDNDVNNKQKTGRYSVAQSSAFVFGRVPFYIHNSAVEQ